MSLWGQMTPIAVITIIALLVVSSNPLATQKGENEPTAAELRLPDKLSPIWYNLTIKPYLPGFVELPEEKNLTFEASLAMKFRVNAATDKIVMNALSLNFSDELQNYTLKQENASGTVPQVTDVVVNKTVQMVIFTLDSQLKEGEEYVFQFDYTGPISNILAGLYLSRYTDDKGEMRYAAVTQMEPTDARRMVPCFDEPQMKAVWKVRVIHPTGTSAISNGIEMIDAANTEDPDWLMTTFKETLPMSPYLIALAVSDFDYVEGNTTRGTRFRIWARKEALNETLYALEAGITALEYYEDFYSIPFPLEKQDMMALPDFSAGAMENWGLVTYREKYLLYNSALDTPQQKQHLAAVVAHELAHQWFGNLVTMKWWNDLWLNEGFATFMEYLGADAISHGDFRMNDTFLVEAVNVALEKDARATSHPLFFPIDKAEDVSEAFDPITYEKGGSIIHMIEDVMGTENFKKGLTIYLNRYQLSNADHNDLWDALSEAVPETLLGWNGSKLDIHEFASRWIEQMGYPVVEITRLDPKTVQLKQKRFKVDNNSLESERFRNPKYGYKYDSPLWYEINGKEEPLTWLHEEEPKKLSVKPDDLLIVNNRARGFYRVNYDEIGWQRITKQLLEDHTKIDMRSRTRLIEDAFALAEADQLPYEVPLKMMEFLDKEDEFLPWQMALGGMSLILGYYGDEPEAQYARDYLDSLISPLYNRINWDELGTSYLDDKKFFKNQMDYMIIGQYCYIRNVNCTSQGIELFKKNFMDPCDTDEALSSECSKVPTPVRTLSYCEGVSQGAEREWNKVFALYNKERVQVERERLLYGLTCSRDTFTLKKLLDLASDLKDHSIRLQDVGTVFALVSRRPVGNKLLFDYFIDNWPRLYRDFKNDQHLLSKVIWSGTSVHGTRYLKQLEQFIKENKKETSRLDVFSQQLENAKTATQWIERNYNALSKWFKTQNEMRTKQTTM